jgi:hypothetical protein
VGRNANISAAGTNATAIGANSTANFANSTAIGTGATTTAANQVTIGGTGSTVRLGGYNTAGVLVNDANGNVSTNTALLGTVATNTANIASLQTNVASNSAAIASLQGQTTTLFDLAAVNRRDINRANEGVALALAMETPMLPEGKTFALSGGIGYYNDRTAGTAAFAARIGDSTALTGGVGIGFRSGEVGARAGVQHAW